MTRPHIALAPAAHHRVDTCDHLLRDVAPVPYCVACEIHAAMHPTDHHPVHMRDGRSAAAS